MTMDDFEKEKSAPMPDQPAQAIPSLSDVVLMTAANVCLAVMSDRTQSTADRLRAVELALSLLPGRKS
jgi:hypothetical protein